MDNHHDISPGANKKLEHLLEVCDSPGRTLILTQDSPDPDALASAAALKELLRVKLRKKADIGYGGTFSRAENRAMVSLLRIKAGHVDPARVDDYELVCLVDTQPCSGINPLPPSRQADVVIDHHRLPVRRSWSARHADVRPGYGASTSILYEYVEAAGLPLGSDLATAMFYGIQSDTQDLGRESSPADIHAYRELFLIADKKKLAKIHRAPVTAEYFRTLSESLANVVVAGTTVVSCVQLCHSAEMIAEVADLLLRLEGMTAAVCYGVCGDKIYLSVRTSAPAGNAAVKMLRVIRGIGTGGGHRTMAGGQVPLGDDPEGRLAMVRERLLRVFAPGKPVMRLSPRGQTSPCLRED
ncbi:MAG: bifunctional oligoribonuclease/PAP phosphatase NrnA [Candidatus Hydrogenedentes bacterium]|nr:bifunctional oligoribonuclease/PAP phosphatase NrnA [Candidatus Hydrogenedentota bacterium]